MACLNLTNGLFIDTPGLVWQTTGTASAGGASITATPGTGVTVTKGVASQFFAEPAGGSVRFVTFGTPTPAFILVLTISDTTPGFAHTRSVTVVNAASTTLEVQNVAMYSANNTNPLPAVQRSPGNNSLFVLVMPGTSGIAASMFRSENGDFFCGVTPFTATLELQGEVTATLLRILHGGTPVATAARPTGECQVTPDPLNFPDAVLSAFDPSLAVRQRDATLLNDGDDCLSIDAISNVAPYTVNFSVPPTFPVVLQPGSTLVVPIRFAPTATGIFNRDLPITRTPANGDSAIRCRGEARNATVSVAFSASVGFGSVPVSSSATRSLTLTASGEAPVTVSIAASSGGEFSWPALNTSINPGSPASLPITFQPTSEGLQSVSLTFTSSATTSPHTVSITGTGCVARARINIETPVSPSLSFGDVQRGFRTVKIIRVRNTGNGTLNFRTSTMGSVLFGVQTAGGSVTSPPTTLTFSVPPTTACGPGPTGTGEIVFGVTFFANGAAPSTITGQLVIDNHNDTTTGVPASFTINLTANIIEAINADSILVIDRSGSMNDASGDRSKIDVAVDAGQLFVQLGRPDASDRIGLTRFNNVPEAYRSIVDLTAANQSTLVGAINLTELNPNGSTTVAGGVLVAVKDLTDHPRPAPPPSLNRAVVVLTDAIDNTAYTNPADGVTYTLLGDPGTTALPMIPGVKVYGVGIGNSIDVARLGQLAQATGGNYLAVQSFTGADYFKLEKHFTQIYMDMVDLATIVDPSYVIHPHETHRVDFDVLAGDVNCMVVVYDRDGLRIPFHLETPHGEIIDRTTVPAGFQLRPGITNTARFLEVRFPEGEPERYAGRWQAVIRHDARACFASRQSLFTFGFQPSECKPFDRPITYGIAIGVGSNLRMHAFVDPAIIHVGQPIRLNALLTEFALPVVGSSVNVTAVAPSGATSTLVLRDDGLHHDGDADDGDYGGLFTQTYEQGNYEFTFRATGYSRDGEPVTREAVRSKYVEGNEPVQPTSPTGGGDPKEKCCRRLLVGLWFIAFLLILIFLLLWRQ